MTNHADKARRSLEKAEQALESRIVEAAQAHATMAHAEATLELAEQARIANLITLSQNPNIGRRFAPYLYEMDEDQVLDLHSSIAITLGIYIKNTPPQG